MADRAIKPKGGSEVENDNYIGEEREVTVDTENGQVRVHDGTTSGGLVPGTGDNLRAQLSSGYTAPTGASKVPLDKVDIDTGGQYDTQNRKFVAASDGLYSVTWQVALFQVDEVAEYQARIRGNGSAVATGSAWPNSTGDTVRLHVSKLLRLNAGDEITFAVDNNSSSSQTIADDNFSTWGQILDR